MARCANCGAPILLKADSCVECGYPLRSGAKGGGGRFILSSDDSDIIDLEIDCCNFHY